MPLLSCLIGAVEGRERPMRYILVFSLTAAILITLASIASGLMALEGQKAAAYTRVTVIQKNQKTTDYGPTRRAIKHGR
jgi:hypothetical protein